MGLTPVYVGYLKQRNIASALLKYGPQFIATLRQLARLRPNLVFVMDPPVFAVAAVYAYCRCHRIRYVMDCHSGVFESPKWRWSLPLQRFFGRQAAAVILTNSTHRALAAAWPAQALVIGDPPPQLDQPPGTMREDSAELYVFAIASPSLSKGEAIPELLEAAALLPQVQFQVSGDVRRADPRWLSNHPPNVRFTGFLPRDHFWAHVRRASAILTLTAQDNTILRGAWEAMFMGRPLITSDTRTLRGYFSRGTLFTDNTPSSIASVVRLALARRIEMAADMDALRREKAHLWSREREELARALGVTFPAQSSFR